LIRARNFTVTLLLRTTRMHSQLLGKISGVVALQANIQTSNQDVQAQGGVGYFSNERGSSVESSLQGISSYLLL